MPQFAILHISAKLKTLDYFDLSAPEDLKEFLQDKLESELGIDVSWHMNDNAAVGGDGDGDEEEEEEETKSDRCRLVEVCRHGGIPIHELLSMITDNQMGYSLTHVAADKYTDRYIFEKKENTA